MEAAICQGEVRQERLQQAILKAVPAVASSHLVTRLRKDSRLLEFIKGAGSFVSELDVVFKLQTEERQRRAKIKHLVRASESTSKLSTNCPSTTLFHVSLPRGGLKELDHLKSWCPAFSKTNDDSSYAK